MLTDSFSEEPFWIAEAGRQDEREVPELPASVDVVIVGGGLTGCAAAAVLARAGRDVLALDKGIPGQGASSRSAGMLGRNFKHSFVGLSAAVGRDTAKAYFNELHRAYVAARKRIEDEGLACDFKVTGRIIQALSPQHQVKLLREYEARGTHLGERFEVVGTGDRSEIGSAAYYGGVRIVDNGSLQPARYACAMLARARAADARVVGNCAVHDIAREPDGFVVSTSRGTVRSRDVIVATNGYTGSLLPEMERKLVPINAYMVATEPLPPDRLSSILRHDRTYVDNRRRANYMRLSRDGRRLLFGGRTGDWPISPRRVAVRLHADMVRLFPQLDDVRFSHGWTGRCAATWDLFPHVGVTNGMHFALGYCFSGNAMGPFLGESAAYAILGRSEASTIFRAEKFPDAPFLARSEALMSVLMNYYRWADKPSRRTAA